MILAKAEKEDAMSKKLEPGNVDEAAIDESIDPVDTLKRIAREWLTIDLKCDCECGQNAACSACEITYLLNEFFILEEQ